VPPFGVGGEMRQEGGREPYELHQQYAGQHYIPPSQPTPGGPPISPAPAYAHTASAYPELKGGTDVHEAGESSLVSPIEGRHEVSGDYFKA
jgi:hypothetical protein